MEHLKMHSLDKIDENIAKIATLFPNCVTEAKDENGEITHKIDFDMLKQELSNSLVEGREERYQFTWPDKKQAILTANAPINKTLRPCREESVDFDNTENLYIEGDNLEVLKLLQETYLGKIKMIYIDPPYNTGNDFVYKDDFAQESAEYMSNSGQTDESGNRLVANTESNGRFHTDWLNMIYPRLKLAKDLLSDDGFIFASIDYNENFNLRSVMNEIFGETNFVGEIYWESKTKSQNTTTSFNKLQPKAEMIFVYSKNQMQRFNLIVTGKKEYPMSDEQGIYREYPLELMNANGIRGRESMIFDISDGVSTVSPPEGKQWQLGQDQVATYRKGGNLFIRDGKVIIKMRPEFERSETTEPFWGFFNKELGTAESAKKELNSLLDNHGFETVKPIEIMRRLVHHATDKDSIVLDFFSGSGSTAHAVMLKNSEDGGHRKFICVQIPENAGERSSFSTICEIGKERIRRAAKKIAEENPEAKFDGGFRVLKCDSSNMQDVYYSPDDLHKQDLFKDNIKTDRSAEDLLFQVMLDLGIMLSSKIETKKIDGKTVFYVEGNYLVACFDDNVDEKTITEIAKEKPYYFVMRDSSMANDSVATNFEQIFKTYLGENYNPDNIKII